MSGHGLRTKKLAAAMLQRVETRLFVSMAFSAATASVFALVTARWLGPSDRGVLVIFATTSSFLTLVGSLGVTTGGRVLLTAKPPLPLPRYLRIARALSLFHVVTATVIGIPILAMTHGLPDVGIGMIFVPTAMLGLLGYFQREALHGRGRHVTAVSGDLLGITVQIVIVAGLRLTGHLDIHAACLVLLVGAAVQVVFLDLRLRKGRPSSDQNGTQQSLLAIVRFSLPAVATNLGQAFVIRGDRLLLGALTMSATVGIYSVAGTVTELLWILPSAIAQVAFRRAALLGQTHQYRRTRNAVLLLTLFLCFALAGTARWLIPALLGADYADSVALTYPLIVATIPMASYQMDVAVLNGLGQLKVASRITLTGSAVLAVACLVLIPLWAAWGAAIASLVAYTVMAVMARLWLRAEAPR
jgi:O-antigen/teichoic acid export membrane protein